MNEGVGMMEDKAFLTPLTENELIISFIGKKRINLKIIIKKLVTV
jgi:hypothetical protein